MEMPKVLTFLRSKAAPVPHVKRREICPAPSDTEFMTHFVLLMLLDNENSISIWKEQAEAAWCLHKYSTVLKVLHG